jgi:SAM-dependent methyltransferase
VKPRHLDEPYASQWEDDAMAVDYPARPPYPRAVFDLLAADGLSVLDVGCGTGDLARPLAARAARVDAVDRSRAMIERGHSLPGGDRAALRWIVGRAEDCALADRYDLVVAGESMHWLDWERVLPRLRAPRLVLVERVEEEAPWTAALRTLVPRWSTNTDFRPYDTVTELVGRGLVDAVQDHRPAAEATRQTVADYVRSLHSRTGLGRTRLGAERAAAFAREVAALLEPHVDAAGCVVVRTRARVTAIGRWSGREPGGSS